MSTLKATTIEPATGTNVTLGTTGDTVALPGNTLVLDTWKDSGGNTLFTSNGSGTVSSVNSGLAGAGPVLIQTQTASGASTVSFTSGIDSTYDKYMFLCLNVNPATDDESLGFHASIDGGSNYGIAKTTTFFDAYHFEDDSVAGMGYEAAHDLAQGTGIQHITNCGGNGADESSSVILYLIAPSSTTYVKHFYSRGSGYYKGNAAQDLYAAGYINTTSAVNAVQFKMTSGDFDATIKLYGVT